MNTPSPPPVPSASSIVQASQTANNINQNSPFASLNYSQGPNGQWTATTTPTGPYAQALATETQALNKNAAAFANEGAPNFDPTTATQNALAMENKYMAPWFQQQQSNLDSKLQNQGFSVGDVAYQNAQRDLQNNQNNWVGGNVAQFEPLAYQQAQENYFAPLQAAQGANQAISGTYQPNFVSTPQTDVTGAYNTQVQGNEFNYGQQMQNRAAMLGGLFSIPSAALGGWARNGFSGIGSLASAAAA